VSVEPKRGMSGVDLRVMVGEVRPLLSGAYLDRVYQVGERDFLFRFRGRSGRVDLFVSTSGYVFVASEKVETPETPSSFAMLLRKYIGGKRVRSVEQVGLDRILHMVFEEREHRLEVFVELFGGGNLVLVRDRKIVMPLVQRSWAHRDVRRGTVYRLPPSRPDPFSLSRYEISVLLGERDKRVVSALAVDLNLGGEVAELVCDYAEVEREKNTLMLSDEEKERIAAAIDMVREDMSRPRPYVVFDRDVPVGFAPLPLPRYDPLPKKDFETFSGAVEYYFLNSGGGEKKKSVENRFGEEKMRLLRQFEQQKAAVEKLSEKEKEYRRRGDAIYNSYQVCKKYLDGIAAGRRKGFSWDEIKRELAGHDVVEKLDETKPELVLRLRDEEGNLVSVSLDPRLSVEENAARYYENAKKARGRAEGARKAVEKTLAALENLEKDAEKLREREEAKNRGRKKTFWFERYRWFFTSDGNLVIAGRDAQTNERVVKRHMKENDRYAHADIHGAPSVIIKDMGVGISEKSLREACEFAVVTSKAWASGLGSADAYWVRPEQVSKTPNPGEFLAKGAFVIRGRKNFVRKIPLRAAVCVVEHEGEKMAMLCPPSRISALAKRGKRCVVIEPGEEKKEVAAREIAEFLGVPVEDVVRVLPPGGVRVVEMVGGSREGKSGENGRGGETK